MGDWSISSFCVFAQRIDVVARCNLLYHRQLKRLLESLALLVRRVELFHADAREYDRHIVFLRQLQCDDCTSVKVLISVVEEWSTTEDDEVRFRDFFSRRGQQLRIFGSHVSSRDDTCGTAGDYEVIGAEIKILHHTFDDGNHCGLNDLIPDIVRISVCQQKNSGGAHSRSGLLIKATIYTVNEIVARRASW